MVLPRTRQVVTRHFDGRIHAYDLARAGFGELAPTAVFRPRAGDEVVSSAVRPDLRGAVYTTLNEIVSLTPAGEVAWTSSFEPHSDTPYGHRPCCALAPDARTVWVYRPDVMAGRGQSDQWVAYDADSGAVVARHELETSGHGGVHLVHPTDGSVYLDVGEGQDGTVIFRGAVPATGAEPEFATYPWVDRCLVGMAPGGEQFMTVDHGQNDVAFHHHPSGDVLFTLPVEAFGHDPEADFVEWAGGYLTPDTAVVTLGGEDEDAQREWYRYHLVDVRTGTVAGELAVEVRRSPYELAPLGDGTWLTEAPSGHPFRWSAP
ncbi:hypothetical protein OG311_38475 (plasmid) [Streptomyces sp. NBC_01343]|uniref:hypothetical protein n=1 Tax=Streptomyces sp. NBC_01343 TaxID=2903832 RepID=UPI002E158EB4|nr:hypothetical protein OG311_38475 [Streptomyces sp. NBC_01343]